MFNAWTLLVVAALVASCRAGGTDPVEEAVFFIDRAPSVDATVTRADLSKLADPGSIAASVVLGDDTMRAVLPSLPSRLSHDLRLPSTPTLDFAIAVATSSRAAPFSVEFRVLVDAGRGEQVVFSERVDRSQRNRWLPRRVDLEPWARSYTRLSFEARSEAPSDEIHPLWGNPVLANRAGRLDRPDLILISIDCLRADHVGSYGYSRETTPHIDHLAEEAVVFENAFSTSAWTLPTHMSMLAGLTPSFHGVNRRVKLSPSLAYLPETLARAGYETIGVVSSAYLSPNFGFERGFHSYRVLHRPRARETIDEALRRLEAASGRNVFLFLHVIDPHWQYDPPPEFRGRFGPVPEDSGLLMRKILDRQPPAGEEEIEDIIRLYDGEVAYSDGELGRFFDELRRLGRYDSSLVVLTSDHGEAFWEHGYWQHSDTLYEEMVRVPLIAKWPLGSPRGRSDAPVSLVDLFPTFIAGAGLGEMPTQGVPLAEVVAGEEGAPLPRRVSETLWDADEPARMKVALRRHGYKYVATFVVDAEDPLRIGTMFQEELYDLQADPIEEQNIVASSSLSAQFRRQLERYLSEARTFRSQGQSGETVRTDELLEKRLRSLGYLR